MDASGGTTEPVAPSGAALSIGDTVECAVQQRRSSARATPFRAIRARWRRIDLCFDNPLANARSMLESALNRAMTAGITRCQLRARAALEGFAV
ncbi:hypothetical protein [Caballeronia grimmiae]|uniref:hypothetical protein n=1 Tax=Caballeronia grimmiae TaxID=1071679 RepID=UPI000B17ACAF|nr:hypothetical protein [Caballeronia grimmiae]